MFLAPKEFNQKVWEVVRQIPRGKVTTYGRIAAMIATPDSMTLKEYVKRSNRSLTLWVEC
ncbi:MAG: MGMT family protein [Chloroflexi bacterium]|nr:MGMT family protein [Chloroflexota bacterium]